MVNKETRMAIGNEVGKFMDMDLRGMVLRSEFPMDQNIVRCQQTSEKRCDTDDGGGETPVVPTDV